MRCDRCGAHNPHTHLTGYYLHDTTYWLCPECLDAIIMVWLLEHETGLQQKRAEQAQGG